MAGFNIAGGYAVFRDYITVIAFPDDGTDPWDYDYCQIGFYGGRTAEWGHQVKKWYAVSQCMAYHSILDENGNKVRAYIDLGREGEVDVWIPSEKRWINEHIPDAGLYQPWSKDYGYVSCVKEIGQHLYVCGSHNQVYRRFASGLWEHMDQGILQEGLSSDPSTWSSWTRLSDIAGISENDIYAAGIEGALFHYSAGQWAQVKHNVGKENLTTIKVITEDDVYIVGRNGTVLKGNARMGFRDISPVTHTWHYTDIEYFNGLFYLASSKGMYTLDPATNEFHKYKTDLDVDLQSTNVLSAKDGVLWSIGVTDIAWFDGHSWTRVDIPGRAKIGGGGSDES